MYTHHVTLIFKAEFVSYRPQKAVVIYLVKLIMQEDHVDISKRKDDKLIKTRAKNRDMHQHKNGDNSIKVWKMTSDMQQ